MRHGGQAAIDPPGNRTTAVAAVTHHRLVDLGEHPTFLDAATSTEAARPGRVHADFMVHRQYGVQALLAFHRLDRQAGTEDRRGGRRAILGLASSPAARHPVIPHEVVAALGATIVAADQQILQVEGTGHGTFRHDAAPQLEDPVHDLLVGTRAETRHRMRPSRIHHAAFFADIRRHGAIEA